MKNLTYKPHIGKNYGNSELGKLLIIGDSHYFNNGLPKNLAEFTIEKIKELRIISASFYDTVDAVLNQGGKHDIWDNIHLPMQYKRLFHPLTKNHREMTWTIQNWLFGSIWTRRSQKK